MKEARNIFGWLAGKQEARVLEDAKNHVEITYKTVESFKKAVEFFVKQDKNNEDEAIRKVREFEHEADFLRKKMVDELSEGLLVPPDREDLMHFVKSLDRIADWTNGAARILGFIEERLPEEVLKNISLATELIFKAISCLKNAIIELIEDDIKDCLLNCEEVDRIEHDADDQKKSLIESILHTKLEPKTLLLSYQLAEYLEAVTDKIEDAADFIKVVAIKAK